ARPAHCRRVASVHIGAEVRDVCSPWSEAFVRGVHRYAVERGARLVVVHSTVPVGTCDANGWIHSPIRGRHPDLEDGVLVFTKHFGGENADAAVKDWKGCGVATVTHPRAAETEAGKLWELAQYGVQIRVEKAIHEWCSERSL